MNIWNINTQSLEIVESFILNFMNRSMAEHVFNSTLLDGWNGGESTGGKCNGGFLRRI